MKKEYRVKANHEFSQIISKKKSVANQCFVIYFNKNSLAHGRVGISVSKKLGNAVIRNKIKRQIRMMAKEIINFNLSYDYVIIVRNNYLNKEYQENLRGLGMIYQKILKRMDK